MGRHRHGRSRTRDAVSLIFSFFFAIVLVLIFAVVGVRFGALSKGGIVRAMDGRFYDYVLAYVNEQANYYTLPTGIDPVVLDGVFQKDEIQQDMVALVETSFDGGEYLPVTANAKKRLTQNLASFFSSQSTALSAEDQQKISTSYTDAIMNLYKEIVALPGYAQVGRINATAVRYGSIALVALVVIANLLVFLIARLHAHMHRTLRYLAYATGGAGLMLVILPLFAYVTKPYTGLNLEPQSMHYLCVTLITNALLALMCCGGVLVLVAAIIAFVSEKRRRSSLHR